MRKRKVADIVTERSCPNHRSPVLQTFLVRKNSPYLIVPNVLFCGHHVEDFGRQIQDTQGVFEALMGSPGIDQIRQRELVNAAQPLKRSRTDDPAFVASQGYESVNRDRGTHEGAWPQPSLYGLLSLNQSSMFFICSFRNCRQNA
jgi:hypothetical protein